MSGVTPGMVRCALCPDCKKVISFAADPVPTLVADDDPLDGNGVTEWMCFWCGYSLRPAFWSFFLGHPNPFELPPIPEWEAEIVIGDRQKELFA